VTYLLIRPGTGSVA